MIVTKLHCKNCKRYLASAIGSVKIEELICAKCKNRNSFDIRTKENKKDEK